MLGFGADSDCLLQSIGILWKSRWKIFY